MQDCIVFSIEFRYGILLFNAPHEETNVQFYQQWIIYLLSLLCALDLFLFYAMYTDVLESVQKRNVIKICEVHIRRLRKTITHNCEWLYAPGEVLHWFSLPLEKAYEYALRNTCANVMKLR